MKNLFKILGLLVLGILCSCASLNDVYRPLSGSSNTEVLGTVQTNFETMFVFMPGTYPGASKSWKRNVDHAAYTALLEVAKKEYNGNIDVYDITFQPVRYATRQNNINEYKAIGKVVLLGGVSRTTVATGVEGALARAAEQTLKNVPQRSKIAIVYITAQDRSTTDYIAGELEYIWVNDGFTIIDRSQLDRLRREQNFQLSGEVDDATAVSIGKFAGANIIVTGRVDGEGNLRRLRLRALDTQTAQVVGVSSERL
ncbi:CsgG/HfaB family protein [Treponema sp. R80B11-R83G3]